MERIYKIMTAADWAAAQAAGVYAGSTHDRRDGFIHFSTAGQAAETAAKHFAGQADLMLLAIDPAPLGPALRWEPSRGGALFPHLYVPLPASAVTDVHELPFGPEGRHIFPSCF